MNDKNNICLIGYMGSGKTTVGRLVSERLGLNFTDTDRMITEREARSIPDIFENDGEAYFRQLEAGLVRELAGDAEFKNTVISTGGGIVLSAENRAGLKRLGTVIYLRARADSLYERVKNDTERPLLKTEDIAVRIKEMLKERSPMYEEAADIIIDTDELDAEETAAALTGILYPENTAG